MRRRGCHQGGGFNVIYGARDDATRSEVKLGQSGAATIKIGRARWPTQMKTRRHRHPSALLPPLSPPSAPSLSHRRTSPSAQRCRPRSTTSLHAANEELAAHKRLLCRGARTARRTLYAARGDAEVGACQAARHVSSDACAAHLRLLAAHLSSRKRRRRRTQRARLRLSRAAIMLRRLHHSSHRRLTRRLDSARLNEPAARAERSATTARSRGAASGCGESRRT